MKLLLAIALVLTGQLSYANMASPVTEGTHSSSAFSSRDIDILKEKIHLKINKEFTTAYYTIEYLIKTDSAGKQIPLLFHAVDYKDDFKVLVDGKSVELLDVPVEYTSVNDFTFDKFSNYFKNSSDDDESGRVEIRWDRNSGNLYSLNDLKYFEADLEPGEHVIKVEYTANAWSDRSDWVREYSFRYSLSPAKHWRSFGSLEITLDASELNSLPETDLGQPREGNINNVATWKFSELPSDYFQVTYKPQVGMPARSMISLGPNGLTLIFTLIMISFHLFLILRYRKNNPARKISWIVIAGSLLVPLIALMFYIYAYDIIDSAIGSEAGKYHGYTFLVMMLYPILMPVYMILMWLIDKRMRTKFVRTG